MYGGAAVVWKWAEEMGGAAPGIGTFLDGLLWFEILVSSLCRCRAEVLFLDSFTSLFACRVTILSATGRLRLRLSCSCSPLPPSHSFDCLRAAICACRGGSRLSSSPSLLCAPRCGFTSAVSSNRGQLTLRSLPLHTYARVYSRCNAASVILRHHPTQHAWLPQYVSSYALGRLTNTSSTTHLPTCLSDHLADLRFFPS